MQGVSEGAEMGLLFDTEGQGAVPDQLQSVRSIVHNGELQFPKQLH